MAQTLARPRSPVKVNTRRCLARKHKPHSRLVGAPRLMILDFTLLCTPSFASSPVRHIEAVRYSDILLRLFLLIFEDTFRQRRCLLILRANPIPSSTTNRRAGFQKTGSSEEGPPVLHDDASPTDEK